MSQFFSAAATATAKKGALVRYRSYRTGTYYDKISERYNHVDIFELQALRVPLDFEKIQFYRENEKAPLITPAGEDGHIVGLSRETYFADQQGGADHVVLPIQFTAKRFKFASREDLELWKAESEEEHINFVGPIPAIVPIREILEATGEAGLLHQAASDRDDAIKEAAAAGPGSHSVYTDDPYNYQENYFPSGPCGHFECGVCYGGLIRFDKPTWFIRGLPADHEKVLTLRLEKRKEAKLRYLYKLSRLMQISTMLSQVSDSMDIMDKPDYYEDMS